jgi:hypothetical protein
VTSLHLILRGWKFARLLDAEQLFLQRSNYFHHLLYHSYVCTTPFVCFTYSTGRSARPERLLEFAEIGKLHPSFLRFVNKRPHQLVGLHKSNRHASETATRFKHGNLMKSIVELMECPARTCSYIDIVVTKKVILHHLKHP